MNQIADAEKIFGHIAISLTADEALARRKAGPDALVYVVDWKNRKVKVLLTGRKPNI